ncbi:MAG: hypothetical protein IE925_03835 [Rhodobacterales bacterium]|nr:hypothetical protein [Rhodobacterales bacterium]
MSKPYTAPLLPAGKHFLTMEELEELAVSPFKTSSTRGGLFHDLTTLVSQLSYFGVKCQLWIDGSFLTAKHDPADIDLTIVIARPDFELMPAAMKNQVIMMCAKQHPLSSSLDCYISDRNDQSRLEYWDDMWGTCRSNLPKGYMVLELPEQDD